MIRAFKVLLVACALLLTGCASLYVDGPGPGAPVATMGRPAEPVQLVVAFQTRGVVDRGATREGRPLVANLVRSSGLFSEVRDTPAEGAGVLTVTLEHTPPPDGAASKGFIVGLTLGLASQQVTDDYTCTLSYLPPGQSTPIVKTAQDAIHMTMGATASAPPNAWRAPNVEAAVDAMVRQVVTATLEQLSHDPSFR
jgi:hypothetical protein